MALTNTTLYDERTTLNQFERAIGCADIMHTYAICNVHVMLGTLHMTYVMYT